MWPRTTQRKCPPLSSFRVWCGLCEDSEGLQLRPTTWEDHVISQVRLQGRTHQVDSIHVRIFLNELRQSPVRRPLRDDL